MNIRERVGASSKETKPDRIFVNQINVRQSIFFLLLKLILMEIAAAASVIILFSYFVSTVATEVSNNNPGNISLFNIPIFLILVVIKIALVIYVIVEWFNEYYVITTTEVIHKKGLFMKREQRHTLEHLGSLNIEQGALGRIFNYGTLRLYNWVLEKNYDLYLVHDPRRYHLILKGLLPKTDAEKKVFREHLIYSDDQD